MGGKNVKVAADFMEGFCEWLGTEEAEQDSLAIDEIAAAFKDATVDVPNRKIIWHNGQTLSVEESAKRIHSSTEIPINSLCVHIAAWLDMHYEP